MVKTKLGIDRVFCISLPTRNDRKEKINQRFGKLDFNFIEAIHGSDIDTSKLISDNKLNSEFYDPMGAINKNVIACSLSHLKCWEIFESSQTDICLILEDDVVITQDIFTSETDLETNEVIIQPSKFWKEMWTQLESLDWDIVFLGKKEKYVDGVDETELFCKPFWSAGMFGGHSYMLNKKSIKKLISSYKPIQYAADVYLDMMSEKMNVYALKKSLFRQRTDIYLHDKKLYHKVDSDTFYNQYRKEKFTEVRVDETVESIEFINYPVSPEFDKKRWPPLIKAKLRN